MSAVCRWVQHNQTHNRQRAPLWFLRVALNWPFCFEGNLWCVRGLQGVSSCCLPHWISSHVCWQASSWPWSSSRGISPKSGRTTPTLWTAARPSSGKWAFRKSSSQVDKNLCCRAWLCTHLGHVPFNHWNVSRVHIHLITCCSFFRKREERHLCDSAAGRVWPWQKEDPKKRRGHSECAWWWRQSHGGKHTSECSTAFVILLQVF